MFYFSDSLLDSCQWHSLYSFFTFSFSLPLPLIERGRGANFEWGVYKQQRTNLTHSALKKPVCFSLSTWRGVEGMEGIEKTRTDPFVCIKDPLKNNQISPECNIISFYKSAFENVSVLCYNTVISVLGRSQELNNKKCSSDTNVHKHINVDDGHDTHQLKRVYVWIIFKMWQKSNMLRPKSKDSQGLTSYSNHCNEWSISLACPWYWF